MDIFSMLRGQSGGISFSRTQAAIGFLVCSGVIIWQAYKGDLSEAIFIAYFGFSTAGYIGAKKIAVDKDITEQKIDADLERKQ